jgi:hypothetical protein
MYLVMGPEAFLTCCTFRLEFPRLFLPKLFRRVYLLYSLIFVVTEALKSLPRIFVNLRILVLTEAFCDGA